MRLIFILLLFSACSPRIENQTTVDSRTLDSTPARRPDFTPSASPPVVQPKFSLNSKQAKYLNRSIPAEIRKFFETADKFELLAESYDSPVNDRDARTFVPNRVFEVTEAKQKKEILDAFYFDASHAESPAMCFTPHHAFRATKDGKTLVIEICFDCARFEGADSLQSVSGTLVRDGRRLETLFNWIIENQSKDYLP